MPLTTTISPLAAFQKAFLPFGIVWTENSREFVYPFKDRIWAERAQEKANRLILECGFHVTASVGEYILNGSTRVGLIIRPAPEEYTFQDEVTDDEKYIEERADWPE